MRKSLIALVTLPVLVGFSVDAHGWCKYENDLEAEIDLGDAEAIEVFGTSGSLLVRGRSGADKVVASGRACTGEKNRIDEIEILVEVINDRIRITAAVPFFEDDDDGRIGSLDLKVDVPDSLPIIVSDSSGDLEVRSVQSLELTDSSGDIEIEDVVGQVLIVRDSSGDLEMRDVGDVVIRLDSSGDIVIRGAASVSIDEDTSGDIRVRKIKGDVTVAYDTSGSINAVDVEGDFVVAYDTGGGVTAENVDGAVNIPD